jgi:hypothetical protein
MRAQNCSSVRRNSAAAENAIFAARAVHGRALLLPMAVKRASVSHFLLPVSLFRTRAVRTADKKISFYYRCLLTHGEPGIQAQNCGPLRKKFP